MPAMSQSVLVACGNYKTKTARTPASTARKSSRDNALPPRVRRDLSTARIWSHTATEPSPAEETATTTGGRGAGPVDSGTTTTVRRTRFNPSAVSTTAGRVFWISAPRAGSSSTHQIDPRRTSTGACAIHGCRPTGGVSFQPSSRVAASHSAISAPSTVSCSTASAAR